MEPVNRPATGEPLAPPPLPNLPRGNTARGRIASTATLMFWGALQGQRMETKRGASPGNRLIGLGISSSLRLNWEPGSLVRLAF